VCFAQKPSLQQFPRPGAVAVPSKLAHKGGGRREGSKGPQLGGGKSSGKHKQGQASKATDREDPAFQKIVSLLRAGHYQEEEAAFGALRQAVASGGSPSPKVVRELTKEFGSKSLRAGLRCAAILPMQGCQSYVALLRMCEARVSQQGAEGVIHEMCTDSRSCTVKQRQTALICAFQCLARMKLPCTAVGVLDAYTVQQSGSGVDVADPSSLVMVNNFLNALATNVDLAHEWFLRLQEWGFVPNLISHNTLLKACMRARRAHHVEAIMESLSRHHLRADEYTYLSLIKSFTYSADFHRALQVRQLMRAANFQPTAKLWGALIIASSQGSLENSFAVWREMKQQGGGVASIESLEAIMNACVGAYQGERALQLLRQAQAEGAELSQRCYNIAIKACGSPPGVQLSRSQLDLGYALLEEMQRGGFGPDLRTYTSLYILGAQAKEGERALDLYLRLKESGFPMDAMGCTALISALGSQKSVASAFMLVFNDMVEGPPAMQPTDRTYRTVIGLCCENGLLEDALQVYRVMRSKGCKPSPQQFKMLTQACAEQALEEGPRSKLPAKMLEILGLGDLYELDLHRLSASEARAVVLCAILNLQQAFKRGTRPTADLVIITGQGNHSEGDAGPTLGPAIAQLLSAELRMAVRSEGGSDSSTEEQPVNLGRLIVPRASLARWLEAKKGAVSNGSKSMLL